MGASQSAPFCGVSTSHSDNDTPKRIRPYNLTGNARHIELDSSYCTLYDGIVSLVEDNKYADLLIICGNDRYPVHRAIVCPRSHFFEECCAVQKEEVDHASPGRPTKIWIDPSECESHILAAVLTFLYTLDYTANGPQVLTFGLPHEVEEVDDEADQSTLHSFSQFNVEEEPSLVDGDGVESITTSAADTPAPSSDDCAKTAEPLLDPSDPPNELVFHTQMHQAGKMFGIVALVAVAKDKFEKRLRSGPWNVEMVGCIREVYRHGDNPKMANLKEDIVKSARSRFRVLKTSEGWEDLVIDFPAFAAELLRRM